MNRNEFLKKTALGLVASSFINVPKLGSGKHGLNQTVIEVFKYPFFPETRNDTNNKFSSSFELKLYKSMFDENYENFENPTLSDLSISMWIKDGTYTHLQDGSEMDILKCFTKSIWVTNVRKQEERFFLDMEVGSNLVFNTFFDDEERTHHESNDISDFDKYYLNKFSGADRLYSTYAQRLDETLWLSPSREKVKSNYMTMTKDREYTISEEDCYLTTCCTKGKGLPDDCEELKTLREFRDEYILIECDNKRLVREYYEMAPSIVEHIEAQPNRNDILDFIYDELVQKSISMIENGDKELAMNYYQTFAEELGKRILN